jgi:hypothetical protein
MLTALLAALVLVPPVGGPVARGFDVGPDPFAGGQHRGADLRAAPRAAVRAPCRGRVAFAGRVGVGVVSVLCGRWRVTVLPLSRVAVRRGTVVGAGDRVGTVGRSAAHAGLHLGVRRDGTRFGYVDPLPFFRVPVSTPVLVGPPGRRPRAPRAAPPVVSSGPAPVVDVPWVAWAGAALLLGAVPVRLRLRRRWELRRRTSTAAGCGELTRGV